MWVKNVFIHFAFSKFSIISIVSIYSGKKSLQREKGQILKNKSSVIGLQALAEKLLGRGWERYSRTSSSGIHPSIFSRKGPCPPRGSSLLRWQGSHTHGNSNARPSHLCPFLTPELHPGGGLVVWRVA